MRLMGGHQRGSRMGIAVTVASLMLLAGCSSVPDAVNPVEWYRGATSLFDEEETPASGRPAESQDDKSQTDAQAYPNLGSVPARPDDISSPSDRRATRQGLVADRDQARYTDQQPANAIGADSSPGIPRTAPVAAPKPTATAAPPAASPTQPAPPAARVAPRAEPTENRSAGTAMLERRRQEILAERAAAAAAAGQSKPPQAPAAAPQPSAPQPSAPAASTEPEAETRTRTVADIYREQLARSASPVATRSAEPAPSATSGRDEQQDTAAPAVSDKAGISYLAATILFGHGSTALDPAERDTLRKIAADYRKTGGTLRIVGHASSRTTDMRPLQHQLANFQVSVSRAETVAQELARLGVFRNAMQVSGVGDSQPIYYEVMPAGESGNRRVEIFVDY